MRTLLHLTSADLVLDVESEFGVVGVVVVDRVERNHECDQAGQRESVDHAVDLGLVAGLRELTHNTSLCL